MELTLNKSKKSLSSVLHNSKKIQLNLIGTPREQKNIIDSKQEIPSSSSRQKILLYLTEESKFKNNYNIIKPIYEKKNKAAFIIEQIKTKKKYILKLNSNDYDSTFEKIIFNILKNHDNQYIIKCKDYVQSEEYYYFIYKHFDGLNLAEYLDQNYDQLTELDIKNIFKQIISAVNFLHNINIVHCDLKLENILINSKQKIKIIDFDLSILCDNYHGCISNSMVGTYYYLAPESHDLYVYSKKTDIWSCGIILYLLITKKFPTQNNFHENNLGRRNQFKHIDFQLPKNIIKEKKFNPILLDILKSLLIFEDYKRANLKDIQDNIYFAC